MSGAPEAISSVTVLESAGKAGELLAATDVAAAAAAPPAPIADATPDVADAAAGADDHEDAASLHF